LTLASGDLPGTGEARVRGFVHHPVGPVLIELVGDNRSGTDEAHVALDDVDQLRQFVE
jgi:hypothetical protein